jgi:hypothetical protein
MGKVLSTFDKGWPGAISRSIDDIVITLKNVDTDPILFGAPVFLTDNGDGVVNFIPNGSQTYERFVGFAVRDPAKTPNEYPTGQDMSIGQGSQAGQWEPGQEIDILVRGSIVVRAFAGFRVGGKVYIRKSDGTLVSNPGSEGTTVWLENVRMKQPQRGSGNTSEVVVTERNIQ